MSLHIFIPCKSLSESKSRLAPVLSEEERLKLSLSLLGRTLKLAGEVSPDAQCHLVSSDPDAAKLAAQHGIEAITGAAPGLNRGLFHARAQLQKREPNFELLILPIDLPDATPSALRHLIADGANVVIAPDRDLLGTNALYLGAGASADFPFRFGEKSFDVHCKLANERGLTLAIHLDKTLAFDLDTPEHLEEMKGQETFTEMWRMG